MPLPPVPARSDAYRFGREIGAIAAGGLPPPAWMLAVNAQAERGRARRVSLCLAPGVPGGVQSIVNRPALEMRGGVELLDNGRGRDTCKRERRACREIVRMQQHSTTQTEIRRPRFIGSETPGHDGKIKRVAPLPSLHS